MDPENPVADPITPPVADPVVAPVVPPVVPPRSAPPSADLEVNVVRMSLEEFQRSQARLQELDRRVAEEERKAREAEERARQRMIENGQFKEANDALKRSLEADKARERQELQAQFEAEKARLAAEAKRLSDEKAAAENARKSYEQRVRRSTKDRDLAEALSTHNLVANGAKQLAALWANNLDVVEDGESFATRSSDGKTAAEFVATMLAQPEYSHFLKSSTTHGGTIRGPLSPSVDRTQPQMPSAPASEMDPGNMGMAALMDMKANGITFIESNTDTSKGFGLRAPRR